ncbi:hypothetical protein BLIG_01223 [Bifidobacterium longum subsp. infantis CCUG 52486]|uniref:Uncharacterized protein n=1 Tax=Bifidobacterium longum subsp. infantis CCUG 52486 TaxID=537937 RepID=C5EBU5_BIFLI|nr:hypothetical protein BLIG_01223 [Bifidobacterium longum subsp. infantis CCUG 52486]
MCVGISVANRLIGNHGSTSFIVTWDTLRPTGSPLYPTIPHFSPLMHDLLTLLGQLPMDCACRPRLSHEWTLRTFNPRRAPHRPSSMVNSR